MIGLDIILQEISPPLNLALHLLWGRWWPIVCPPSVALCSIQNICISGAVHILLSELTYPLCYTRLRVVHLVTHWSKGLTGLCSQSWVINLVALCMLIRVLQSTPWMEVHLCAYSVVLFINSFHCWLAGSKKTMYVVKPSLFYKRNYSVMKTLVLYVKEKWLCRKTLSCPVFT